MQAQTSGRGECELSVKLARIEMLVPRCGEIDIVGEEKLYRWWPFFHRVGTDVHDTIGMSYSFFSWAFFISFLFSIQFCFSYSVCRDAISRER